MADRREYTAGPFKFERLPSGSVRVSVKPYYTPEDLSFEVPANEWPHLLAWLSNEGPSPENLRDFDRLHWRTPIR